MSKSRYMTAMTICTVLLIAVCAVVYLREDRVGPQIRFDEKNKVYQSNMTEEELLVGVQAEDARDQDVTDTLLVDKVIEFPEENYVIVTYIAKDRKNNVTKENRWMEWIR